MALASLSLLAADSRGASARGLACQQSCSAGTCSQVACDAAVSGDGFCQCGSGALPLGGTTFASWCRAWERPSPACTAPNPAEDAAGRAVAQPAVQLANADAMGAALQSRNPYVATLMAAMQADQRWIDGPVRGSVHDSSYDEASGVLSHAGALVFVGQARNDGLDAAQIDIAVTGDIEQLAHLKLFVDAATPSAVPPRTIHGTITGGGLHGSLRVVGAPGRSELIEW